jgi:hypothetical protein
MLGVRELRCRKSIAYRCLPILLPPPPTCLRKTTSVANRTFASYVYFLVRFGANEKLCSSEKCDESSVMWA